MSTQHTPGPWHWVEDMDNCSGTMAKLVGSDGREVCDFGDCTQYYPTEGTEPEQPDMDLIAAAPDLLAALRDCLEFLEKDVRSSYSEPEKKKARSAIAKAVGSGA